MTSAGMTYDPQTGLANLRPGSDWNPVGGGSRDWGGLTGGQGFSPELTQLFAKKLSQILTEQDQINKSLPTSRLQNAALQRQQAEAGMRGMSGAPAGSSPSQILNAGQESFSASQPDVAETAAVIQAKNDRSSVLNQQFQQLSPFVKPIELGYGGSVYDPITGQTKGGVAGSGGQDLLSSAMLAGHLDPSLISRYGMPTIIATLQKDPNFDFNTGHTAYERGISNSTQLGTNPLTGDQFFYDNKPPVGGGTHVAQGGGQPSGPGIPPGPTPGTNPGVNANPHLPVPQNRIQADYLKDFTSGPTANKVTAINTAIGHLFEANNAFSKLPNSSFTPANAGINWFNSTMLGTPHAQNYVQAQQLFSKEIANAYGADTLSERLAQGAIGSVNNSPEQHKGFVRTAAQLLGSKVSAEAQKYLTAMGTSIPSLDMLISPQSQTLLNNVGIRFILHNGQVGTYTKEGKNWTLLTGQQQ